MLRNNKKYTTLETQKSGVRFTNTELKQLSTEHQVKNQNQEPSFLSVSSHRFVLLTKQHQRIHTSSFHTRITERHLPL